MCVVHFAQRKVKMSHLLLLLLLSMTACSVKFNVAASSALPCVCDNENASYIFDDSTLRQLELAVLQMNMTKQTLRMRMETLTARLDHQNDLLSGLREQVNVLNGKSIDKDHVIFPTTPLIDVRGLFDTTPSKDDKPQACASVTRLPQSCAEATANSRKSGLYTIQDDLVGDTPFWVSCDEDMHGGAWTVIQRRIDGSVDFYRNWTEYKSGFGKVDGEFWIGLDKLHALTTRSSQELLIVMEDFDNVVKYAKYDAFAVGDESEAYTLKVLGKYSGDAGDSLTAHASHKFSAKDEDNDNDHTHCAQVYLGAWWYNKCHISNLNGKYLRGAYNQDQFAKGVVWHTFRGYNYALKSVQMMVRPRRL